MCGIAGVLSLEKPVSERDLREVREMTGILRHRGPDTADVFRDERCVLGNTRLKIIDLSESANLPMSNESGNIRLAYNGEVMNFRELEEKYGLRESHEFRSRSDSEVLVHLYEELGIDFLQELSGYFALCIYDMKRSKAYVARDFYGVRPLFYMIKNKRLYFASEIKSFLHLSSFDHKLDHEGIYHFFSLAYIPGHHTPFEDIKELDGGWLIEADFPSGEIRHREYYRIIYRPDHSMDETETSQTLHGLMLDSVRRNLISDAPLGLTLSGGFDTSTILALTKELGVSEEIHTFSIKINEPSFDESYWQRVNVDFARPVHHQITVNPGDVLDKLIVHMAYMDEPSGDGAAIPTFLLAEEAKKYVRVLLSGEGGDEVFNAYETHGAYVLRKLYRRFFPSPARKTIRALAKRLPVSFEKLSLDFLLKRFTEGVEMGIPESHLFWRYTLKEEEKKLLMSTHSGYRKTDGLFRETFDALDFDDDLNRISLLDLKYFFIGDLMVKNDRMLMAHSIEGRFPYMDRMLVEFVSRMPTHMRVRGLGLKRRYIQKKAMKGYVPKEIFKRPNMGLEMPHSLWFFKDFRKLTEEYLSKKNVEKAEILDYRAVKSLLEEHLTRKKDNGRALWCIIMFLLWFDLFVYNKDFRDYLNE